MKLDMNRMLVEAAIRRALRGMEADPERSLRNLIDLGLTFSNGRFQRQLLGTARDMLRDQSSAYYGLVRDALQNVDHGRLTTLGLNLGYNACTRGAAAIRGLEAERGYNIPWLLSLGVDCAALDLGFYGALMDRGMALGIYTYALFPQGDPTALLPLIQGHPDCACLLFLPPDQVTEDLLTALGRAKNVLPAVSMEGDFSSACARLRAAKFPFALWRRYGAADRSYLLEGRWLREVLPAHPLFALLLPEGDCPQEVRNAVYGHLCALRESQDWPVIPLELLRDGLAIDEVISDDGCLLGFAADGTLHTHLGTFTGPQYDLFHNSLEDILARVQALRQ